MANKTYPTWVRRLSFLFACSLSLLILIFPHIFGRELTTLDHSVLPFFLAAIGASYAFGLGFTFYSRAMRVLTSPFVVWPVLALALIAMILF